MQDYMQWITHVSATYDLQLALVRGVAWRA